MYCLFLAFFIFFLFFSFFLLLIASSEEANKISYQYRYPLKTSVLCISQKMFARWDGCELRFAKNLYLTN